MVRAMGAALLLLVVTGVAQAEESVPFVVPTDGGVAEERAFAADVERFTRLRSFTEQLMAKREAEAFEQATLRQARIAKLQRELADRETALSERQFTEAVALYLRKRELTRELAASAGRAKTAPPPATSPAAASPVP
jgi:hypothetical protein